jgi:spermidine/putrescine-binding protein
MKRCSFLFIACALVLAATSPARAQLKLKTYSTKIYKDAAAARAFANAWISDFSKHAGG